MPRPQKTPVSMALSTPSDMLSGMPAVRKRFIVSGNVQDVAYRAFVKFIARRLGLAGFARNLDDGTVEVVCEGDEQAVKEFLKKIDRKGDPESFIDINVDSITETPAPGVPLKPFDIDYGKKLSPAEKSTKNREELAIYGASEITQGLKQVGRDVQVVGQKVDGVGKAVEGVGKDVRDMRKDMNTRFDSMADRYDMIAASLKEAIVHMDRNAEKTDRAIEKSRKESATEANRTRKEIASIRRETALEVRKSQKETAKILAESRKEVAASNRELAGAVKFMIRRLSDRPARKRSAGKRKRK